MKSGDHLDVNVSSLGDATSLEGGVLLQTPLSGANTLIYAVAQGQLSLEDPPPVLAPRAAPCIRRRRGFQMGH